MALSLLVGTRKGCSCSRATSDRRDWEMRGPFCEGWPVYHAVHDPEVGHDLRRRRQRVARAGVWRSRDRGETWELSSEGLGYADGGPEGLEDLGARGRTRARAGRRRGGRHVREPRRRRDLVAAEHARGPARARATGTTRPTSRPGISGLPGDPARPRRRRRASSRSCRASACSRRPTTARAGRRATAGCAPTGRASTRRSASASTSSSLAGDPTRLYQQNHCGMHRSDDGGHSWTEITEGLPSEFGFAAAAHPHDRDTFYVIPLDPGHAPLHARGAGGGLAHARRRRELAAARPRAAPAGRPPRRAARGDGDRRRTTSPASTSARAPARSSRAPTRARAGARSRATCPAIWSVEVATLA